MGKISSMPGYHYTMYTALLQFMFSFSIIAHLINTCIDDKFLPRCCKKAFHIMLYRILGNFKLGKLCVIQLLETNLNMHLCLVWGKRLIHSALNHNLLNPEQSENQLRTMSCSASF